MSERTSEEQRRLNNARTRAVNQAKRGEVKLIREGRGTRDWTQAQQREWLRTGRCRGIKGHHMKDVSTHPEYAGDRNNIQMLNGREHLAAHGGNFKNKTNGYYNPDTGRIKSFGENPPTRPADRALSAPLSKQSVKYNLTMRKRAEAQKTAAQRLKAEGKLQGASRARVPKAPEKTDSKTLARSRAVGTTSERASTQSRTLARDRARSSSAPSKSSGKGESRSHSKGHSH